MEKKETSLVPKGFDDLFGELERQFFTPFGAFAPFAPYFPRYRGITMRENEAEYRLSIDMPGVREDELKVSVSEYRLDVSAARKKEGQEREYAHSITLPRDVDLEHIAADYTDGVLELTMPKTKTGEPRNIPIKK
jgi:HSP20 family protein